MNEFLSEYLFSFIVLGTVITLIGFIGYINNIVNKYDNEYSEKSKD